MLDYQSMWGMFLLCFLIDLFMLGWVLTLSYFHNRNEARIKNLENIIEAMYVDFYGNRAKIVKESHAKRTATNNG